VATILVLTNLFFFLTGFIIIWASLIMHHFLFAFCLPVIVLIIPRFQIISLPILPSKKIKTNEKT